MSAETDDLQDFLSWLTGFRVWTLMSSACKISVMVTHECLNIASKQAEWQSCDFRTASRSCELTQVLGFQLVVCVCRTAECAPKDPPALNLALEHICGRPLGLRFDPRSSGTGSGDLYIADAYFGLLSVGPEGGLAKPVTNEVDGVPFVFTNDVDVAEDGVIYFTDTSTKYQRRWVVVTSDS